MFRRVTSLALLMVLLLGGCTNRLILPEAPSSPVTVYLMDHGRHASLILPGGEAQWTRYVHGEWRWYALDDTGLWRGIQALLWPTDATIGRRGLTRLPTPGSPSPAIPEGFLRLYPLTVEAGRVSALRARLDRHFHAAATSHLQPRYNLVFVPYPRAYWVFHHSNEVMAQWLRALGVEVRGSALLSRWRLERPAAGQAGPTPADERVPD